MPRINPPHVVTDPFGSTITLTESGQIAAYKGNRWTGSVHIEREGLNHEDTARSLIQGQVREGYIFPKGVVCPFASAYFIELKSSNDGHDWTFVVERDYLD